MLSVQRLLTTLVLLIVVDVIQVATVYSQSSATGAENKGLPVEVVNDAGLSLKKQRFTQLLSFRTNRYSGHSGSPRLAGSTPTPGQQVLIKTVGPLGQAVQLGPTSQSSTPGGKQFLTFQGSSSPAYNGMGLVLQEKQTVGSSPAQLLVNNQLTPGTQSNPGQGSSTGFVRSSCYPARQVPINTATSHGRRVGHTAPVRPLTARQERLLIYRERLLLQRQVALMKLIEHIDAMMHTNPRQEQRFARMDAMERHTLQSNQTLITQVMVGIERVVPSNPRLATEVLALQKKTSDVGRGVQKVLGQLPQAPDRKPATASR
jgi:hypothetical protein